MNDFWIGANSFMSTGNWTWIDKTAFNFTNWRNESDAEEILRCASLSKTDGYWTADDCFIPKGFVCAIPTNFYTTTTTSQSMMN